MKKVLFIGGSWSDIHLIEQLKSRGVDLTLLNNLPIQSINQLGDSFVRIDYRDIDKVYQYARNNHFDHIIPGANDSAYITASYTSEKLNISGLDSFENAKLIHLKDKFKNFLTKNKFNCSSKSLTFKKFDNFEEDFFKKIKFPLIVKPIDMSGGKGISIAKNFPELQKSIEKAFEVTTQEKIVIEEYFSGSLISLSGFIVDGCFTFYYFDNEFSKYNSFQVSSSIGPLFISENLKNSILKDLEKISKKLGLVNGLLHTQILINRNYYSIIEITRRTPGDLYSYPVFLTTGLDYTQQTLNAYMNESIKIPPLENKNNIYVLRHSPSVSDDCIFKSVLIDENYTQNLIRKEIYLQSDEVIYSRNNIKIGAFIFKFESRVDAEAALGKIDSIVRVEFEKL